jgi:hypothetical protein
MAYFPFLPRAEANDILEQESHADEARGEYLAETGSSCFYWGMSADDASFQAQVWLSEREREFQESPEGEVYYAKLEAAKLFASVSLLHLRPFDLPEFFPGMRYGADQSFTDDIPF